MLPFTVSANGKYIFISFILLMLQKCLYDVYRNYYII